MPQVQYTEARGCQRWSDSGSLNQPMMATASSAQATQTRVRMMKRLTHHERIGHFGCGGNPNAFSLQVFVDHLLAAFAADAGAFVTAER